MLRKLQGSASASGSCIIVSSIELSQDKMCNHQKNNFLVSNTISSKTTDEQTDKESSYIYQINLRYQLRAQKFPKAIRNLRRHIQSNHKQLKQGSTPEQNYAGSHNQDRENKRHNHKNTRDHNKEEHENFGPKQFQTAIECPIETQNRKFTQRHSQSKKPKTDLQFNSSSTRKRFEPRTSGLSKIEQVSDKWGTVSGARKVSGGPKDAKLCPNAIFLRGLYIKELVGSPMYSLTEIFPNFLHASGGGPQQEEAATMAGELLSCIYIDICIAFFIFLISPTSRPGPIRVQPRSN
ncbi:RNA-binding (RRM/RBD/RNP motifs) family protein [Striga asiatica]|uniref:RNA-binding (RRM/RBD/RNP motifs) family protein n=1 Tax=Striga asiatica TaxID=4170 RepID=A0A5A7QK90_STRAF|nr:RNA-binding (RRM/RBD/RNP motifs) family protein [Striga asiatica]